MADNTEAPDEGLVSQTNTELPTNSENLKSEASKSEDSNADSEGKTKQVSPSSTKQKNASKVDILLKHAGDAPIMSKRKWTVDRTKKISWVASFIKKFIKSDPSESLFLYVNQSFAPAPDTDLGSIFDCFGSDGKLVLHYCRTQAWG